MGNTKDLFTRRLTAAEMPEETRTFRDGCLKMLTPLLALLDGEADLTTVKLAPIESTRRTLAILLDVQADSEDYALLKVEAVPLSKLDSLPRHASDYAMNLRSFLSTVGTLAEKTISTAELQATYNEVVTVAGETFAEVFGEQTELLNLEFDLEILTDLFISYIALAATALLFAEKGNVAAFKTIASLLRILSQVLPFGITEESINKEGLIKLIVLCRG